MARTDLHRRLTTSDAAFLYVERANQPMHIGSCNVYESRISREELIHRIEERMHLLPRYRQRVIFPPFGLAHPTWEDDPDFDVANHVEEMELPAPADDQVLSQVGGRVHAGMLDRNRPLWKLVLLHGYQGDKTAMIAKVHHAMVDGVSGVELQMVLHDLSPDAPPPDPPDAPWQPKPLPDPITLWQEAVRERLVGAAQRWTDEAFRLLRPRGLEERARTLTSAVATSMPALLRPAPRVPFNGPVGTQRQFAWAELAFAEIRFIRTVFGGTVNDVVLAVISGGLGRYLRAHGVATRGMELRAMCPVSMRRAEQQGALGNLVSIVIAPLYVDIADPAERLAAERAAMERLKGERQADGLYALTELTDAIPPPLQAFAAHLDVPNTLLNTVSTNVPGPQIPLYLGGCRLAAWYPLGPLASGIGLFNAILSYNQKVTIGPTVDPRLVPDVWFYVDCLKASFADLLEAAHRAAEAARIPAPAAVTVPPRKARTARGGKSGKAVGEKGAAATAR